MCVCKVEGQEVSPEQVAAVEADNPENALIGLSCEEAKIKFQHVFEMCEDDIAAITDAYAQKEQAKIKVRSALSGYSLRAPSNAVQAAVEKQLVQALVASGIPEETANRYTSDGYFPNGHTWTEALCLAIRDDEFKAVETLVSLTGVDLTETDHVREYTVQL